MQKTAAWPDFHNKFINPVALLAESFWQFVVLSGCSAVTQHIGFKCEAMVSFISYVRRTERRLKF